MDLEVEPGADSASGTEYKETEDGLEPLPPPPNTPAAPKRGPGRPRLSPEEKAEREARRARTRQLRDEYKARERAQSNASKGAPPDFTEWQGFFGEFLIKWICRGIVAFVFRNIPNYRDFLTPAEQDALELDKDDVEAISRPLARYAEKSLIGKKYGRDIIDSRDAIQSLIALAMWTGRIRRIERKYNPKHAKPHRHGRETPENGPSGETVSAEPGPTPNGVQYRGAGQYGALGVGG